MPEVTPTCTGGVGRVKGIDVEADIDGTVPHLIPYFLHERRQGLVIAVMRGHHPETLQHTTLL